MNASTHELATDRAFELLADRTRRRVIRHLVDADGPVTVDELVEAVVTSGPADTPPNQDGARTELLHVHLPKLLETGSMEHDPRTGVVRYYSNDLVENLLAAAADAD